MIGQITNSENIEKAGAMKTSGMIASLFLRKNVVVFRGRFPAIVPMSAIFTPTVETGPAQDAPIPRCRAYSLP
jgi:hypothetical protein